MCRRVSPDSCRSVSTAWIYYFSNMPSMTHDCLWREIAAPCQGVMPTHPACCAEHVTAGGGGPRGCSRGRWFSPSFDCKLNVANLFEPHLGRTRVPTSTQTPVHETRVRKQRSSLSVCDFLLFSVLFLFLALNEGPNPAHLEFMTCLCLTQHPQFGKLESVDKTDSGAKGSSSSSTHRSLWSS